MHETTKLRPRDRAEVIVTQAEKYGWVTGFSKPYGRHQLVSAIRIALDAEVAYGGPFFTEQEFSDAD